MADSPSTAIPEATKASTGAHSPVQDIQMAPEAESDRASIMGERMVRAVDGGSLETPPRMFAEALGQLGGMAQVGMLRGLQRGYGNSYVGSVIQAKLTVGQPGDVYEQEADRVADAVMRMPKPTVSAVIVNSNSIQPMRIQRMCTECAKEEEEKIHPKESPGRIPTVTPALEARFEGMRGGGEPLPEPVRSQMESRLGTDLSEVRVHTDSKAHTLNQSLQAQAFTHQRDIYFGAGKYNPDSSAGQHLLAHELTHVIQQSQLPSIPSLQREGEDTSDLPSVNAESFAEQRAERPGETTDETLRQNWIAALEYLLQRANTDFAYGMLEFVKDDETEFEYWLDLSENPVEQAYYFRAALILRDSPFATQAELSQLINNATDWAKDEKKTLETLPDLDLDARYPAAFPATWSKRVASHLQPPSDLDLATAQANLSAQFDSLKEITATIPADVYEEGLPVSYAAALSLDAFPFKTNYTTLDKPVSIRNFALQAQHWIKAFVTKHLAEQWLRGKKTLVDDIAQGRKIIDTYTWHLVSDPRNTQPDLSYLANEALSQNMDIFAPALQVDVVHGWEYELALAKLAVLVKVFPTITANTLISNKFSHALAAANVLVATTEPEERIDVANRWAENWGYGSAALDAQIQQLDGIEIAKDIAKDALLSAIPVVGWFWRAKELVEEISDLYDAGANLYDAYDQAEGATTVVALQRAAAKMIQAKYGAIATVGMTAVSKGVSSGAKHISDKVREGKNRHQIDEELNKTPQSRQKGDDPVELLTQGEPRPTEPPVRIEEPPAAETSKVEPPKVKEPAEAPKTEASPEVLKPEALEPTSVEPPKTEPPKVKEPTEAPKAKEPPPKKPASEEGAPVSKPVEELQQQRAANEKRIAELDNEIRKYDERSQKLSDKATRIERERKTSDFREQANKAKKQATNEANLRDKYQAERNHLKNENERISREMNPPKIGPGPGEPHGGAHKDIPTVGGEVNHIPADSVSPLSTGKGSSVWMEKADHMKTKSWGSSDKAKAWRAKQKELIDQGKFREAVEMDLQDIRSQFGNKYDKGIKEMLDYIDSLDPKDLRPK